MRIYPCKHEILSAERPRATMIPLGHIEKEYFPSKINVDLAADFSKDSEAVVRPYDTFDSDDDLVFDEAGKRIKVDMKRVAGRYVYEPEGLVEYTPDEFSVSCLIKKRLPYYPERNYDLKIAVDDIANWEDLISLFGNAPMRGLCPPNVYVNSMSTDPMSLVNADYKSSDFLFISSIDGYTYSDGSSIDLNEIMNYHCNIWLSIDENDSIFAKRDTLLETNYTKAKVPVLYSGKINIGESLKYLVKNDPDFAEPLNSYQVVNEYFNSPVIMLHRENGGYIIVSHTSLFDDLNTNAHFIYEVLMSVYLNSYIRSMRKHSWITSYPVEYIDSLARQLNKTHMDICLTDMLQNAGCLIDQYEICDILVDTGPAVFTYIDSDKNLHFEKYGGTVDPKKGDGHVAILTNRGTIILYEKQLVRKLESRVHVSTGIDEDDNSCYIYVDPFVSSKHRVVVEKQKKFSLPHPDRVYCLLVLPVDETGYSTLQLIERSEFIPSDTLVATVSVEYKAVNTCSDVRMPGGGLPELMEDNYDMLDIGNLYGRPYRVGATLIFRLPARLKKYDDKITAALERYKNAADHIVIHYEG